MKVYIIIINSVSSLSIIGVYGTYDAAQQKKQDIINQGKYTNNDLNILEFDVL